MHNNDQKISLRELSALRRCDNLYTFERLKLNSSEDPRFEFITSIFEEMKTILLDNGTKEECHNRLESFFKENYSSDWFTSDVAYEKNKEKDTTKAFRLIDYILDSGAKVMGINIPISVSLPDSEYHSIQYDIVNGRIDLLLRKEDEFEAINFKRSEPTFSYRARKPVNIAENSLTLSIMMLGLTEKYPNLKVSLYYFKNKDDKGDIFQAFENKKGNNTISTKFESFFTGDILDREGLLLHIQNILALSEDVKCSDCLCKGVCKFSPVFRFPTKQDQANAADDISRPLSPKLSMTDKQLEVVTHVNGPMNVIAIPGAGKTRSLVTRMEYLIKERGIRANNILFVTFTNKACEEIKNRVSSCLEEGAELPHIYTFNGLGYQILRDNSSIVGKVKLAADTDRLVLIGSALGVAPPIKGYSYDGLQSRYGLIRRCDKWFDEIEVIGEEAFKIANPTLDTSAIFAARKLFLQRFHDAGYINYRDQINLCNELFMNQPKLLNVYSRVYKYIMVDEYQDVDEEQVKLIYSLASHRNLVVVGDDDQSIYKFRGGSNRFMLEFSSTFTEAKTVIMGDNFRSNNKIVRASEVLINHNVTRFQKEFISHKDVSNAPMLVKHSNKDVLLHYLSFISKKYKLGDIAIISRNNSTLFDLADHISPHFKVTSPKDFLIDDTVFILFRDLLNLYFNNLSDDRAFFRLAKLLTLDKELYKADSKLSLYDNLLLNDLFLLIDLNNPEAFARYCKILEEDMTPMMNFGFKIFRSFKEIQYSMNPQKSLEAIFEIWCGATSHPVLELLFTAMDERQMHSLPELYFYMNNLVLYEDSTRVGYGSSSESINLLTAHDSKGREFPVVLIYGVEDFSDSGHTTEDVEEERRLLFVAMTRAENNLILFSVDGPVSQFVSEVEPQMKIS